MRRAGVPNRRATQGDIAAINPLSLGSCRLVWDMLDRSSYTVANGLVTTIRNLVTGEVTTEGSVAGTTQPLFLPTGLNGTPCMAGDRVDKAIATTEAGVLATFSSLTWTLVMAMEPEAAPPTGSRIWSAARTDQPTISVGVSHNTNSTALSINRRVTLNTNITCAASYVGPKIVTVVCTATPSVVNAWLYVNRKLTGSGITTTEAFVYERFGLFARLDDVPDAFSSPKVGAVALFAAALDERTIFGVAKYFASPRGIPR